MSLRSLPPGGLKSNNSCRGNYITKGIHSPEDSLFVKGITTMNNHTPYECKGMPYCCLGASLLATSANREPVINFQQDQIYRQNPFYNSRGQCNGQLQGYIGNIASNATQCFGINNQNGHLNRLYRNLPSL